jgi:hypothetical protein
VYVVVQVPGVKGSPDDLLVDVQAAAERANAAMDRDGEELVWSPGASPATCAGSPSSGQQCPEPPPT